jgi:uncharacterized protein (TIRG00374 family)
MKRNLLVGILFSGLFVYFAVKNVNLSELKAGFNQADYSYLIPIFFLSIFILFLRSYRWAIILSPLERVGQQVLFPITVVGLMAVVLLPMRVGEFVRPYLVSRRSEIGMTSAFGTIVVERTFDVLTLMLFLLLITHFTELPRWAYQVGISITIFFFLILFLLVLLIFKRDLSLKWIGLLLGRFPNRIMKYLTQMIISFSEGLKILPDAKSVIFLALLSIFLWVSVGICIYILFHSFHFGLPLIAAYVVLVITTLGIMVPTAPGFVGNFHLFCVIGLSLFGIPKPEALSFAILLHFIQVGLVGLMGLALIPFIKIPFLEVFLVRKQVQT